MGFGWGYLHYNYQAGYQNSNPDHQGWHEPLDLGRFGRYTDAYQISTLGLILFIFTPKVIYVKINDGGLVEIGGRTSRFRNLFREEQEELAVFLSGGGDKA